MPTDYNITGAPGDNVQDNPVDGVVISSSGRGKRVAPIKGPRGLSPRAKEPSGLRRLTGQGGVALVMFNLARQKIDFVVTPDDFHLGDLWIAVKDKKYGVEVKTSRSVTKWQINKTQVPKIEFYALVNMSDARCYIFTSEEMSALVQSAPRIYGDIHLIDKAFFPQDCLNAWWKLGIQARQEADIIPGITISPSMRPIRVGKIHKPKIVHKTLADGTVKSYRYPR